MILSSSSPFIVIDTLVVGRDFRVDCRETRDNFPRGRLLSFELVEISLLNAGGAIRPFFPKKQ